MLPDDERARRQELERRRHAKAIVDSPLWDEAYTALFNDKLEQLLAPGTSDEATLALKREILSLNAVKNQFATVIQTGDLAQKQLEAIDDGRTSSTR